MEEKEITPGKDYVKGFNEGYLLSQHEPELAAQLSKAEGTSERLQGMKDGHKRFELERDTVDRAPWEKSEKDQTRSPGKNKIKGRDIEPDR